MKCEEVKPYLAAYLDGELPPETKKQVERHLAGCAECSAELEEMRRIRNLLSQIEPPKLPDIYWKTYWSGIYNRIERAVGWILLSVGTIILMAYGLYMAFEKFFTDPSISIVQKIGVGALGLGIIVLLVSIIRERIFAAKHERYSQVER